MMTHDTRINLERLLYWIRTRHAVFVRREAGLPKPWTRDPFIANTFFTNPYRENDKVTRWVASNIRRPLSGRRGLAFALIAFRWFNWIPTGNVLLGEGLLTRWDVARAVEVLTRHKESGAQVFTGAFNISNSGSPKPKINRVCEDYIDPVWRDLDRLEQAADRWATLAQAQVYLQSYPGLGGSGFMAAQVVADLKHTAVLRHAHDWWTWCSKGPGSVRGLNLLCGRPAETPLTQDQFVTEVNTLREHVNVHLARTKMPPLCAQDLQNCLCEYFKYVRALRENGRAKRKYDGGL